MKFNVKHLALASTALVLAWPAATSFAQVNGLEEIVVTARQRQENLVDIPLSITTFSSENIDQTQLKDIQDLQKFTPGFSYRQANTQTGARMLPSYRFRGMNAGAGQSLAQLGAVFVDGLYLLGGAQSMTFDDVERIEVIKGPQSAYFGRSTFGGAVNFITKEPKDHFSARASASAESYDGRTVGLSAEGPLTDWASFRISGSSNQVAGQYKSSDGGRIGRQRTDTINGQLILKPVDGLKIRLRYTYADSDDSPAALVDMNAGRADIEGNSHECQPGTAKYWCGELPKMGATGVPKNVFDQPTSMVTPAFAQTAFPNMVRDILNNNKNNPQTATDFALHNRLPSLDHLGLHGIFNWFTAEAEYETSGGYALHGAFGKSTSRVISASSLQADGASVSIVPGIWENTEGEVRLSSPQDQRLTWLVGGNVFRQAELGIPTSGFSVRVNTTNGFIYTAPQLYASQSQVNYWGVFAGAHYSILDNLSLDLEGRYQHDKVTNAYQTVAQLAVAYKAFAPRVILTYHPMQDFTVYASWARGVNPGFTNASVPLYSATLQAQIKADPGYIDRTGAETLDSFEIGVKQQLSWLRYGLTVYYGKWKNLKNQVNYTCPANQCGPTVLAPFASVYTVRTGKLLGLEAEVNAAVTENIDLSGTLELVGSRFDGYSSPTAFQATGRTFGTNLAVFEYPTSSASVQAGYHRPINDEYSWYVRSEFSYTGKTYLDEFNQAWIGAATNVNLRIGVQAANKRVEFYTTNLFDNDQWQGGRRGSTATNTRNPVVTNVPSAFVIAPRKRAFGVRASYEF